MKSYHRRPPAHTSKPGSRQGLSERIPRQLTGLGGTIALVIVMLGFNLGVISYHGDPRQLFGLVGGEPASAAVDSAVETEPALSVANSTTLFSPKKLTIVLRKSSVLGLL